jgi:hypothetical protein
MLGHGTRSRIGLCGGCSLPPCRSAMPCCRDGRTRTGDVRLPEPARCHLRHVSHSSCWWSGRTDSNRRPPRPERGALPSCATTRWRDGSALPSVAAARIAQYPGAGVPTEGLEPPRPCGHTDLNRARLPVPPGRREPASALPAGSMANRSAGMARPAACLLALCSSQGASWRIEAVPEGGFEPPVTPGLGRRHVPVLLLGLVGCQGGSRTLTPRLNGTPHCRLCYLATFSTAGQFHPSQQGRSMAYSCYSSLAIFVDVMWRHLANSGCQVTGPSMAS